MLVSELVVYIPVAGVFANANAGNAEVPLLCSAAPADVTWNGYVAATPSRMYPSFHVAVGVAAFAGRTSVKNSTVLLAVPVHEVPLCVMRPDIWSFTELVAAVLLRTVRPFSADVTTIPGV